MTEYLTIFDINFIIIMVVFSPIGVCESIFIFIGVYD